MQCSKCNIAAPAHELAGGKCLKCLHQENQALLTLLSNIALAIEASPYIPGVQIYRTEFTQTALDSIKTTVQNPVKMESKDLLQTTGT